MKITVNNIDRGLRVELSQVCEFVNINDNPKGVFLQWTTPDISDMFDRQTKIIDKCIKKKIPMIIFDQDQKISPEEASFFMTEGAFLWEPAVDDRMFFSYQPCWGKIIKDFRDIPTFKTKRHVKFGYAGSLVQKMPSFKEYYVPIHEIGEFGVFCVDNDGNKSIYTKIDQMGIPIMSSDYEIINIGTTLLIGSEHDYKVGKLDPDLFKYLESGVVPLLPKEHRWFHSVFGDLVVDKEEDIEYVLRLHDKIAFGCINEMYQNIDAYLPEADVKNVSKRIVKYFS